MCDKDGNIYLHVYVSRMSIRILLWLYENVLSAPFLPFNINSYSTYIHSAVISTPKITPPPSKRNQKQNTKNKQSVF